MKKGGGAITLRAPCVGEDSPAPLACREAGRHMHTYFTKRCGFWLCPDLYQKNHLKSLLRIMVSGEWRAGAGDQGGCGIAASAPGRAGRVCLYGRGRRMGNGRERGGGPGSRGRRLPPRLPTRTRRPPVRRKIRSMINSRRSQSEKLLRPPALSPARRTAAGGRAHRRGSGCRGLQDPRGEASRGILGSDATKGKTKPDLGE